MESIHNWRWLKRLAKALNTEYRYRYNRARDHGSYTVIRALREPCLPDIGLTELPQAMPERYRVPHDTVQAYRNYYIGEKKAFAHWTKRRRPPWFKLDKQKEHFR